MIFPSATAPRLTAAVAFTFAAALGAALACALTACGGVEPEEPVCVHAVPPPIVAEQRITRIDLLDLGETRDSLQIPNGSSSIARGASYGYDLDGLCSSGEQAEPVACRRATTAASGGFKDGHGGVDNAFNTWLLEIVQLGYPKPSETMAGFSYLETQRDGRGTLYLGTSRGIHFVIPLVAVRLAPPTSTTLGTLAAIIPRDALNASLRERLSLAFGAKSCADSSVQSVIDIVSASADVPVSGAANADVECDGISIGLRLSGTTVDAVPPLGAGCPRN